MIALNDKKDLTENFSGSEAEGKYKIDVPAATASSDNLSTAGDLNVSLLEKEGQEDNSIKDVDPAKVSGQSDLDKISYDAALDLSNAFNSPGPPIVIASESCDPPLSQEGQEPQDNLINEADTGKASAPSNKTILAPGKALTPNTDKAKFPKEVDKLLAVIDDPGLARAARAMAASGDIESVRDIVESEAHRRELSRTEILAVLDRIPDYHLVPVKGKSIDGMTPICENWATESWSRERVKDLFFPDREGIEATGFGIVTGEQPNGEFLVGIDIVGDSSESGITARDLFEGIFCSVAGLSCLPFTVEWGSKKSSHLLFKVPSCYQEKFKHFTGKVFTSISGTYSCVSGQYVKFLGNGSLVVLPSSLSQHSLRETYSNQNFELADLNEGIIDCLVKWHCSEKQDSFNLVSPGTYYWLRYQVDSFPVGVVKACGSYVILQEGLPCHDVEQYNSTGIPSSFPSERKKYIPHKCKGSTKLGYGLVTGKNTYDRWWLAVVVRGQSAERLLSRIFAGEVSETITWTGGNERYLLFNVPERHHAKVENLTSKRINQFDGFSCDKGEWVEFLGNNNYVVLPLSFHPETGYYRWEKKKEYEELPDLPDCVVDVVIGEISAPSGKQLLAPGIDKKRSKPPTADELLARLESIPKGLNLVVLEDKAPRHSKWQTDIWSRKRIEQVFQPDYLGRKKTGYGLVTGKQSDGSYLIAIDVDGHSSEPLLERIFQGKCPTTVSWTSGKTGRCQLLFKVPPDQQEKFKTFTRKAFKSFEELKCKEGEELDFRGSKCQSVLPPSKHPEMGRYKWLNSFDDCEIADLPAHVIDVIASKQQVSSSKPTPKVKVDGSKLLSHVGSSRSRFFTRETSLKTFSDRAVALLTCEQIYNHQGKQSLTKRGGTKVQGCCPVHGGDSGTSFVADQLKKDWYCHSCGVGGGPIQYQSFRDSGNHLPRGSEWVAAALKIIEQAGLLDEYLESQSTEPPGQDEFKRKFKSKNVDSLPSGQDEYEKKEFALPDKSSDFLDEINKINGLQVFQQSVKYLAEINPLTLAAVFEKRVVAILSPKGSGKTKFVLKKCREATKEGRLFLFITHRRALAENLAIKTGTAVLGKICKQEDGLDDVAVSGTICFDSLDKLDPSDYINATIIIDEVEGVNQHKLTSSTCCKKRKYLLSSFAEFIAVSKQTIIMDADLTARSIEEIKELSEKVGIESDVAVIINTPKQTKRDCFVYPTSEEFLQKLLDFVKTGKNAIVHTGSQKPNTLVGTINLEKWLLQNGIENVIRVDSDTVDEPTCDAYRCTDDLMSFVKKKNPQVIVASSVIETGVDLNEEYFDAVFGVYTGIQSVNAVCQSLDRVRTDVPRHIYVAKNSHNWMGTYTDWREVIKSQNRKLQRNLQMIGSADRLLMKGDSETVPSVFLVHFAKIVADQNSNCTGYGEKIISKLQSERYNIIRVEKQETEELEVIKEEVKVVRDESVEEESKAVVEASRLSEDEFEELQQRLKNGGRHTKQQKRAIYKYVLWFKYGGVDITSELVERDGDGLYPHLQLLYYLTLGNKFLNKRDKKKICSDMEHGTPTEDDLKRDLPSWFKPDLVMRLLSGKVRLLKDLDIEQFLDPSKSFTNSSLQTWFEEKVKPMSQTIKDFFGVTFGDTETKFIAGANRLLKCLGLKLEYSHSTGPLNKRRRVYRGCEIKSDNLVTTVLAKWFDRDENGKTLTALPSTRKVRTFQNLKSDFLQQLQRDAPTPTRTGTGQASQPPNAQRSFKGREELPSGYSNLPHTAFYSEGHVQPHSTKYNTSSISLTPNQRLKNTSCWREAPAALANKNKSSVIPQKSETEEIHKTNPLEEVKLKTLSILVGICKSTQEIQKLCKVNFPQTRLQVGTVRNNLHGNNPPPAKQHLQSLSPHNLLRYGWDLFYTVKKESVLAKITNDLKLMLDGFQSALTEAKGVTNANEFKQFYYFYHA